MNIGDFHTTFSCKFVYPFYNVNTIHFYLYFVILKFKRKIFSVCRSILIFDLRRNGFIIVTDIDSPLEIKQQI